MITRGTYNSIFLLLNLFSILTTVMGYCHTSYTEDEFGYKIIKYHPECNPSIAPSEKPNLRTRDVYVPTFSPFSLCRDYDDYCEAIYEDGKLYPVCNWLQDKKIENIQVFIDFCAGKNYKLLKSNVDDACPYLNNSPYKKAFEDQCDSSGNYSGDTDKKDRAVIKIKFHEICQKTCNICEESS